MSLPRASQFIEAYVDGPVQLRRILSDVTAQKLQARPVSGRWSTCEVVWHLVDREHAWCQRMKRVIAEVRLLIIGHGEIRFTAVLAYHQHDLKEELILL
jgi:uncharacterized damage-inducible protein DinB